MHDLLSCSLGLQFRQGRSSSVAVKKEVLDTNRPPAWRLSVVRKPDHHGACRKRITCNASVGSGVSWNGDQAA